jgi:hypothetical protein
MLSTGTVTLLEHLEALHDGRLYPGWIGFDLREKQ